jgi:hypothetical protein
MKSVYDHLSRGDVGPSFSRVWRSKLPEKIKIFMWVLEQKAILTKDNILGVNGKGTQGVTSVRILKIVIILCLLALF